MRTTTLSIACALVLVASSVLAQPAPDAAVSAASIRAHMTFLASDLLLGREAGSLGFDIAANYVASQFAQLGLTPAGEGGTYFQTVPLLATRSTDEGRFVLTGADGRLTGLVFGEDYLPARPAGMAERRLSAPLVFVGFGVVAPERGRDDYRGLNVAGRIVVVLAGAPSGYQSEERAYYASLRTKRVEAARRGAIGVLLMNLPSDEAGRAFSAGKRSWQAWSMTWRQPDGAPFDSSATTPFLGQISAAGAQRLLTGAKATYADIAKAAAKPKGDPPRLALSAALDVTLHTESKIVESRNVMGLIEGADPKLKDEVVVMSAHLDHIGVSTSGEGDLINNGALDNAAGVATTLEAVRAFQTSGRPPRRSILVLTVTGEEKGLLGAEYFARNPTLGGRTLVANVDLDMPVLLYDFTDVVAFGAERSGIGPAVRRAAARVGVAVSPDPLPEQGLFIRSDHYRFVEIGVPAVFLMTGFQNGGEAKFREFLATCYHRPCDDLSQPIDYAAGAKFARLNYEIARELADMDVRPMWNAGDFFGGKFGTRPALQPSN